MTKLSDIFSNIAELGVHNNCFFLSLDVNLWYTMYKREVAVHISPPPKIQWGRGDSHAVFKANPDRRFRIIWHNF